MPEPKPTDLETGGASEVETSKTNKVEKEKITDSQKLMILGFVEYLIDTLTFKRVFLVALLGILGLVMYGLFEHRDLALQYVLNKVSQQSTVKEVETPEWDLSDNSKEKLVKMVDMNSTLKYVSVSEVELKKNTRAVRFSHIKTPAPEGITLERITYVLHRPRPLFDYDTKNTEQMVAVLANEFRCDNFSDTNYAVTLPEVKEHVTTICRIAIPPFVGKFVGFITVGLEQKLSKAELDMLRLEVSQLAVDIYLSDVQKEKRSDSQKH